MSSPTPSPTTMAASLSEAQLLRLITALVTLAGGSDANLHYTHVRTA